MAETEMVEEVKGLIAEGFGVDKIKSNLLKIGYSDSEADVLIKEAQSSILPKPVALPEKVAEEPDPLATLDEGLEGMQNTGDDDLLLAAGGGEPIEEPTTPVALPPVKKPPAPPVKEKEHHGRHRHEKTTPPKTMDEGEKPKSGAGKAIMIFLFAFIVIAVMAYFILLPKLGISLTL